MEDGVDAIHVSTGSSFPHPRSPIGGFPIDHILRTYDTMLSSSLYTERNFKIFLNPVGRRIFKYLWHRTQEPPEQYEGVNARDAHAIRDSIRKIDPGVPVIVTGGFQTGRKICEVIERGDCDAVSIARPLIANNDLVRYFERGEEVPENKRCTYCNKCLVNTLKNPLGCYELLRYDGDYDAMVKEIMSVFHPRAFQ